ncbi:hypothetical protein M5689_024135 [Euphorbia peplus]|nr:hypothetical protein M5689_024135 [Euphorbia peplus]
MGKTSHHHHHLVVPLVMCLLIFVASSHCSRHKIQAHTLMKQLKPKSQSTALFGFLPKAMPIPPSGPSREHNGIGLQSTIHQSPP